MSSKHWMLVSGVIACLLGEALNGTAQAAPWGDTGNVHERVKLQRQADRGEIDRSVTTWPMMLTETERGGSASVTVSGTTGPAFLRGYGNQPRESGELTLGAEWQSDHFAGRLQVTGVADPEDDQAVRGDGSYLAGMVGNWMLGAGLIDRWWGPGWQSSLILSNNARPVPAVWLNRRDPKAFETPWLSWIGPWQITAFLGQLEEERAVPDPYLAGMRLTIRPIDGLDIGFSRTFIIGGEGRSSSFSTFWDALIGDDNTDDAADDPSNQLGAIDVRYGFAFGEHTASVYTQMMGEDEAGALPSRKSWLFGVDWTTALAGMEQQWYLEATDTLADHLTGSGMKDISYEHRVYQTGYRYRGRNMATSIEADTQAVTFGMYNFTDQGQQLGLALSWLDLTGKDDTRVINPDPDVRYSVPGRDQERVVLTASFLQPLPLGTLGLYGELMNDEIELIDGERDQWSAGASWTLTF